MTSSNQRETVLAGIDFEEVVELALALGEINSPPGKEGDVAGFVLEWLKQNSLSGTIQEVSPGRHNVVAAHKGTGNGRSLILNSHFDTAYGDPMDIWTAGRFSRADTSAWIEGDRIYGQGVVNDKAPMAATLMVLKALQKSGVTLPGDLIFMGVAGEIGRAPIDEYRGALYEGKGIGTRYAVTHGIVADYALVAECTNWTHTAVECGCLLVKVAVQGKAVYTPFLDRPERSEENPNAIARAARFVEAFEEWAIGYQNRNTYESRSGPVVPKASIGAIRGGLPYKPIETAGVCALYLDIRLAPHIGPLQPLRELQQLLSNLELEAEIEPFLFRRGYEGENTGPLENAIEKAHEEVFGRPTGKPDAPVSSMWRDLNVFNEVGIPSVTFGPPLGLSSEGWSYFIKKEDLIRAARIYTMIAMDICSQTV